MLVHRLCLLGTGGLAALATDYLTDKLDTFALVGFGLAERADLGAYLAEELLVVALKDDQRVFVAFRLGLYLHLGGKFQIYGVGVTERQLEYLTGGGGTIAYADQFKLLAVAGLHAYYHVVDERAVQAVLCAVLAVVGGAGDVEMTVGFLDFELGVDSLCESAFGAFDGYYVVLGDFDFYASGDFDGCFTYT